MVTPPTAFPRGVVDGVAEPCLMKGIGDGMGAFTKVPGEYVDGGRPVPAYSFTDVPVLWVHLQELHDAVARMRYTWKGRGVDGQRGGQRQGWPAPRLLRKLAPGDGVRRGFLWPSARRPASIAVLTRCRGVSLKGISTEPAWCAATPTSACMGWRPCRTSSLSTRIRPAGRSSFGTRTRIPGTCCRTDGWVVPGGIFGDGHRDFFAAGFAGRAAAVV